MDIILLSQNEEFLTEEEVEIMENGFMEIEQGECITIEKYKEKRGMK